VHLSAEEKEA
nr:somatotropin releasing 10-peptide [Sus scrofa domesticus]prf//710685B somatoliberin [Sus scrofa domesticus]